MTQPAIDSITGLAKREALDKLLEKAITGGEQGCLTLALCDIDQFLHINENFGHDGGDTVLKALADTMCGLKDATAIRYGGDEFAIVFNGLEREQAFLRLEALRAAVAEIKGLSVNGADKPISFTISVGLAACPIDGGNQAELLRKADAALYRAKLGGRNKVMLAYEEKMVPKTAHFTATQLERLADLAKDQAIGEAVLLREALDDLLIKYVHGFQRIGLRSE